jgi:hypothetical protein
MAVQYTGRERARAFVHLQRVWPRMAHQDQRLASFPDGIVRRLAGRLGEFLEIGRGAGADFRLVEAGGGQLEDATPHAVALVVRAGAQVAEPRQRPRDVVERAGVQPECAAELGQSDAVAMAGDLLEHGKGAIQGLDAAVAAVVGLGIVGHGTILFHMMG